MPDLEFGLFEDVEVCPGSNVVNPRLLRPILWAQVAARLGPTASSSKEFSLLDYRYLRCRLSRHQFGGVGCRYVGARSGSLHPSQSS